MNNMKLNQNDLTPITVETKSSIELKSGVWNANSTAGTDYIPNDAPDSYKIYRRLKLGFLNSRANLESLYFLAGGIDTQKYLDAIKEIENNMKKLEEHYKYKSVALLIVNRNDVPQIQLKLFNDQILCNQFLVETLGVTYNNVVEGLLPDHLKMTQVFDQEWYTSAEQFIKNVPNPNNMGAKIDNVNSI